jgi:hypothetical protein
MHWYTDVIRKYAVFNGRAARPEFWWFVLINLIIGAVIYIVVGIIAGRGAGQAVSDLYSLAVFLPSLGVIIRRLHDTNRTGLVVPARLHPGHRLDRADRVPGKRQRPRVEQLRPQPAESGSGAGVALRSADGRARVPGTAVRSADRSAAGATV